MEDNALRILLIEDNPFDARLIQELFKEAYNAATTIRHENRLSNGLNAISEEKFDAVFLDLSLPDVHGLETVTSLIDKVPDLPVIVLTGYDDEESAVNALKAGAQDYLVKTNITPQQLGRTLKFSLERKRKELDLSRKKEHFGHLAENSVIGIGSVSSNGDVIYMNNTLKKYIFLFLGKVPEEGENLFKALPTNLNDQLSPIIKRAINGEKLSFQQSLLIEGEDLKFWISLHPLVKNEAIYGVGLFSVEMTENQ